MPEDNIVVFKTMKISIKQDFRAKLLEKKRHITNISSHEPL